MFNWRSHAAENNDLGAGWIAFCVKGGVADLGGQSAPSVPVSGAFWKPEGLGGTIENEEAPKGENPTRLLRPSRGKLGQRNIDLQDELRGEPISHVVELCFVDCPGQLCRAPSLFVS